MPATPLDFTSRCVLRGLYELAQLDRVADAGLLAHALGIPTLHVVRALLVLDAQGLVRADRVRLTLLGLATAARLPALQVARRLPAAPRLSRLVHTRAERAETRLRRVGTSEGS